MRYFCEYCNCWVNFRDQFRHRGCEKKIRKRIKWGDSEKPPVKKRRGVLQKKHKKHPELKPLLKNLTRESKAYLKFKKKILKRDGFSCVRCGGKGEIHVHHIKEWVKYPELRMDEGNCITLCFYCHTETHPYMKEMYY